MNVPARITVTAAEFTRQFGHLRQSPGDHPVHVTHHGRETHVLLSAARYDALRRLSVGGGPDTLPSLADFVEWIEHGVLVLDATGMVTLANGAAHAAFECERGALAGRMVWDAVPLLARSLVEAQVRRVLLSRERSTADFPSPVRAERWVQLTAQPAGRSTIILIRDISEEVRRHRLADEPAALSAAIARHDGIGHIRINPRGHIVAADPALCALVMLPTARLIGVALADLVPTARKAAMRQVVNRVLEGDEPAAIATELLANDGQAVPVRGVLAGLRGIYGQDGAVLVLTGG